MRRSWRWGLAGVALAALAARLALLLEPASPEVGLAYAVARNWGEDPGNVVPGYAVHSALWWQRPLAFLLLAPAAAAGPTAFRVGIALAGALLPVMVAWTLQRLGTRPWVAVVAGLVAALHPTAVHLGTDAWPAALAASFALGALVAFRAGRPATAGGLALAAAWSHPAGLAAPLALLAAAAARAARRGEARLYPLELDQASTAGAAAVLLGALPVAGAWLLGQPAPPGSPLAALVVLLAPALLLVGARGGVVAAVAVALVFAAAPALPALAPERSDGLDGAVAALGPRPWDSVLLVDVDWRLVPHPFADGARAVGWSYTTVSLPPDEWVAAVEGSAFTVLAKEARPVNEALRAAYAECAVHEGARYVVLDGGCTPGHGDAFRRELAARSAPPPGA